MSRTKEEVLNELDALELERREFMEEVRNGEGTFDKEAANAKLDNFKERKAKLEQEFAEFNRPVEKESTALKLTNRDFLDAITDKRAIKIGGTGKTKQVQQLFEGIGEKDDILNTVSFEYTDSATAVYPLLEPGLSDPQDTAEGGSVTEDSTAKMDTSEIRLYGVSLLLPITADMLKLGSVDIESKLPELFKKALRKVLHKKLFTGTFAESNKGIQGVWTDAALNKTGITSIQGTAIKISELAELALKVSGFDEDFEIIMNEATYQKMIADPTAGEDVKIYKEGLIRDKKIEGVHVRIDNKAPKDTSAGAVLAVAAPLSRYHLAVAGEMEIVPIKKVNDTNTYFQAETFIGGRQVTKTDFYSLAVAGA